MTAKAQPERVGGRRDLRRFGSISGFLLPPLFFALCGSAAAAPCRMETWKALHVDLRGRAPTVEGTVNGHPLAAILDTGAFETSLLRGFVERASLDVRHIDRATVVGIGGKSEVYRAHVDALNFGPLAAKEVDLDVVWNTRIGPQVDAVIGVDLLLSHDLEMALSSGEVRLFHPVGCADSFLAYWDKEASVVPMSRISNSDERQLIVVQVNGVDLRALVDSGASRSVMDAEAARRAGVPDDSGGTPDQKRAAGAGSRLVEYRVASVKQVVIGRETIRDTKMAVSELFRAALDDVSWRESVDSLAQRSRLRPFDMILGQDFLTSHRVLFSVRQQRFYFSYVGGRVFDVGP